MGIWGRFFNKREGPEDKRATEGGYRPIQNAEELYNKGVEFIQESDWKNAIGQFEISIKINPRSANCWYALGISLVKMNPGGTKESETRELGMRAAAAFKTAVELSDTDQSLKPDHYHLACKSAAAMYKAEKQHAVAVELLKKALGKRPDDIEVMEGLVLCYLEEKRLEEAEQMVNQLLDLSPDFSRGRKLWKQIRKAAGKSLYVDLPEEKRKEIYRAYMRTQDSLFLKTASEDIQDGPQPQPDFSSLIKIFKDAGQKSHMDAEAQVVSKYAIRPFELRMIFKEGKQKAWRTSTFVQEGTQDPRPIQERYRDSLQCVHCGKRNTARYWPENGDYEAFYFQSEERTSEMQGEFRLSVDCPFCGKTWVVVWDKSPDHIAGQFVRHIERMCEAYAGKEKTVRVLKGLITDELLGAHLKFLKKNLKSAFIEKHNLEDSVVTDQYFSTITFVPATMPNEIVNRLGGSYTKYMDPIISKAEMDQRHTVHWILACAEVGITVHMAFIPKINQIREITTIVPIDLLNDQEKAELGL